MTEQVELTDPVDHSVGGVSGHIFRWFFHISMSFIPLVYFNYGNQMSEVFSITDEQLVSTVVILIILAEALRLKLGITIFGQRDYESAQISALAWGGFAVGVTILTLNEQPELVWPLILSLSLGDPFLGELRRRQLKSVNVFIIGSIFVAAIWISCFMLVDTKLWLALIMAPICVAAEWPRLRWIDDNATMLLIPLSVILILLPWF